MKIRLPLLCLTLSYAVFSIAAGASLKVVPELTTLWLLEGSPLKLDCISDDTTPFDFYYKNGELVRDGVDGYHISKSAKVSNNENISTLTLTKNVTKSTDSQEFECKTNTGNWESRIRVRLFTVTLTNDKLVEGATSLNLKCVPEGTTVDDKVLINWTREGKAISSGEKYKVHPENQTLELLKPERADMGEYTCEIIFNPGDKEEHIVKPQPVFVEAPPKIDSHSKSKNMVQGEQLDLWCKVSGYPFPDIEWRKDGELFNTTTRIHLLEYEGSPTGKLTIYTLDFEDKGTYTCKTFSEKFENITDTAEMVIRVKDKLAALWPFLGIVAEVIVLCTIILIYEKKKSKQMQDEDDSPDANEEEKKDHKDVRHRRT